MKIIGRKKELQLLERAFSSGKAQFLTVYGRRRVGKTFLIREFFKSKKCHFLHVTGLQQGTLHEQLENFTQALSKTFFDGAPIEQPKDWGEALTFLNKQIQKKRGKVVIFFDELPWMVTRKSGLLNKIDFYWNNQWSGMDNIIFIACGSSASWLLKNIIFNKGGLHNRTTLEIRLLPFKLAETQLYLKAHGIRLNEKHIVSIYMAIGGIPYYLDYVAPGFTAQQVIQQLFFEEGAPLLEEYSKLFDSLFDDARPYRELIEVIAQKKEGVSRDDLVATIEDISQGGLLTDRLQKLADAGFIEEILPWGKKRGVYYKVIDEFCLFYIRWIKNSQSKKFAHDHWMIQSQRPAYYAWGGYAFEALCSKHIQHIIKALDIKTVNAMSSWRFVAETGTSRGAQIDLLIDRIDDAITLCEIKYTEKPFIMDKAYADLLMSRMRTFQTETKTTKQIFFAMVSAAGLKKNLYSHVISGVVTLEDFFQPF